MKSNFSIEEFNTLKDTTIPYVIPDKVLRLLKDIERKLEQKMVQLKNAKNDKERKEVILKTVIQADFILTKEDAEYVKKIYLDAGFKVQIMKDKQVDPYADGRFHPVEYVEYTKITLY